MISTQQPILSIEQQPTIHLVAVCIECHRRHEIHVSPLQWLTEMENWRQKHLGHTIEFHSPKRRIPRRFPKWIERFWSDCNRGPWWLDYAPNADIKLAYQAGGNAYTISLASLASSTTLVAGQESTSVDNTSNLYLDYMIFGTITVGTTPTTTTVIEVWAYGYASGVWLPDVFDGTDSAETITSVAIKQAALRNLAFLGVDSATSNRPYPFAPVSLAAAFNGVIPKNHGLFVTHNTVAALNSTAGNHTLYYTGIYITSI